ncbi:MAG: sensor histidine kinase N-terminal domain-containing protein [Polaromonas sp.]|nr:sensor histidine kinase N-terminal domain-containing protein [Polaromonas sp.]
MILKPSLRSRVVKHVVLPLVLLWALGTAVALSVANYFAGQAFDRSLLDDAYAVAANVRVDNTDPVLNLSPPEMSALLFDQSESMYFAVQLPNGALLAGHAGLRAPPLARETAFGFADITFQNRALRSVSLHRYAPTEFTVVVAQTTVSRTALLQRMLGFSVVPQIALLALLVWWLRRVIQADLLPLAQLQRALGQRGARDLSPMPASVTQAASTRDVEKLGTSVDALLARLNASIIAQREFAGNVAHELRTPLAGIRAQADYALSNSNPAIWREQLQGIVRGQERASHLVEQLLGLALADEAQDSLQILPIAINEVARDVLLRYIPKADAAGVDLGGDGLDERVVVQADAALLEGMLVNLLDNALRYGAAVHPQVTVAVTQSDAAVTLSVTDNGPGMTAPAAAQLRQRWALGLAGQRLGEGAGLGLAIVSRYAELLGAQFSLNASPGGHGLQATVTFSSYGLSLHLKH